MNSPFHSVISYQSLKRMTVVLAILGLGGCMSLFPGGSFLVNMKESFESDYAAGSKKVELLKPVPQNREAVHLEIYLVEKPLFDPWMGNKLWKEVDQIAGIDIGIRENLRQNGFRIGRVSSRPPVALQSLLGLTSEFDESLLNNSKGISGRKIFILPGSETILLAGSNISECQFRINNGKGSEQEIEVFKNANCVFRLKAERLQDGFANLKFIPEIQHGENKYRHLATEEGWVGRTSKELAPFFHQQFEMNLNIGEMAIISVDPGKAGSLGNSFFVSNEENKIPKQRLLVVRLAEMKNMVPLYPEK
jgi:hypothetical protein